MTATDTGLMVASYFYLPTSVNVFPFFKKIASAILFDLNLNSIFTNQTHIKA